MKTVTLVAVNHTQPTFDVPAYVYGTCAVHRPAECLDPLRLSTTRWRVSHIPTGATVYTTSRLQTARRIARELGHHPLYAEGTLKFPIPKAQLERAYAALQDAIREAQ